MQTAVVVMSRIPQPGFTKTRLKAKLSDQECADFHRACLLDVCSAVRESGLSGYVYFTAPFPSTAGESHRLNLYTGWDLPVEDQAYFLWRPQQGSDLGQRLLHAAQETLQYHESVLLVGSDIPELSPTSLLAARARLTEQDVVIGPSLDGGYYLVGIKQADPVYLFQDIPWGTSKVMENTLERIRERSNSVAALEIKADIDTWNDLVGFYRRGRRNQSRACQGLCAYKLAEKLVNKYGL